MNICKTIYRLRGTGAHSLRPFLATNTILSVLPVCSLHMSTCKWLHMLITGLILAFHIIFTRAPVNFMWAQTWVAMPGCCYATGVAQVHILLSISTQSSVHRPCCHSLAGTSSYTVKKLTVFWSAQLHSFCVHDTSIQGLLIFWTVYSWEASPPFVN